MNAAGPHTAQNDRADETAFFFYPERAREARLPPGCRDGSFERPQSPRATGQKEQPTLSVMEKDASVRRV